MTVKALAPSHLAPLRDAALRLWSAAAFWTATLVKSAQFARAAQTLSRMSDRELAQIGVARGDIAAHAHRMVFGDK